MTDVNIRILAEDLNDIYPRKVYFFPETGKVLVKKLMQLNNYTLVRREHDYASRLQANPINVEIELNLTVNKGKPRKVMA